MNMGNKILKPILAITMGDPAGIGAEIVVKALAEHADELYSVCTPVVVGDRAAMQDALGFTGNQRIVLRTVTAPSQALGAPGTIDLLDLGLLSPHGWEYKKVSRLCGEAAFRYVEKGIQLASQKQVHGVVTGPINKEALNLAGHHYAGHTEIFAAFSGNAPCAMMLCTPRLRVIHCTTHVPMRKACDLVTYDRVLETIRLAQEAMSLLGNPNAKIGVAGLNAHASENGLFGFEEKQWIIPAIEQAKKEGLQVDGPVPPDTVFVKAMAGMYDIVVAMYHDHGHIPVKLSGFQMDLKSGKFTSVSGVNTTIGLPVLRTSVDHGTAFDRAGDGISNEESMVDAIKMAALMAKNKFSLSFQTH